MKRNIMVVAVAAAVGAAALGSSCTPMTECDYIDRDVEDPVHPAEDDVAYCWQGYDVYGLYAFRFELGNESAGTENLLFVEDSPNALEPAGAEYVSRWALDPDVPVGGGATVAILNIPDLPTLELMQVEINQTSMIITPPQGSAQALRRAVCRGFGFETPEKQCRGSAGRP